ncbi:MAG: YqgE/AlgH family protein [Candidatus Latescibacterota bacterium]|jgi:putative transcriptional regulator|tara:strand:- start:423 stop:1013 length:591 start_codon:yes stop_codon:yes gene_type:complete
MPAPLQKGTVLVASQDLQEDYFARTVILITHHDEIDGTMGLVLNSPMAEQVQLDSADELRRFAESDPTGSSIGHLFFEGGPIKRGYLFYLHRLSHIIEESSEIFDGLYIGGDLDAVRAEAEVVAAEKPLLRFFMGYAGWESGQLKNEIERGAWILAPGNVDLVFTIHTDNMWHDALHALGGKYRALAELPVDPAVN